MVVIELDHLFNSSGGWTAESERSDLVALPPPFLRICQ